LTRIREHLQFRIVQSHDWVGARKYYQLQAATGKLPAAAAVQGR
jgi:hypothetical protein